MGKGRLVCCAATCTPACTHQHRPPLQQHTARQDARKQHLARTIAPSYAYLLKATIQTARPRARHALAPRGRKLPMLARITVCVRWPCPGFEPGGFGAEWGSGRSQCPRAVIKTRYLPTLRGGPAPTGGDALQRRTQRDTGSRALHHPQGSWPRSSTRARRLRGASWQPQQGPLSRQHLRCGQPRAQDLRVCWRRRA